MFPPASVSLFVWQLAVLRKNYSTDIHKLGGKVVRGPWRTPFDFGGNPPDHVTLGLWLPLGGSRAIPSVSGYVCLAVAIHSGSAALAEVCALLSVTLFRDHHHSTCCRRLLSRLFVSSQFSPLPINVLKVKLKSVMPPPPKKKRNVCRVLIAVTC